jgi:hypothetical protein
MNFKKDIHGFISIIDGVLAISIILIGILLFNSLVNIPFSDYSTYSNDFKTSQDIMEILATKVNDEMSVLENIENILRYNNNSKNSIIEVSNILNDSLKDLEFNNNFYFTENNYLNGEDILSSGNINQAENISVATRNIGNYSFTLYVW